MARKSTKENKNIYQRTREGLGLTREEASQLLVTMSPERIEKIENERSMPHPDEVLLMSDRIDEWMLGHLREYAGKPLKHVAKGELPLDEAPNAYKHFDARDDGWTKVILKPAA